MILSSLTLADDIAKKIVPNFKSIRNQFLPQSNILSKRSIFNNFVFKFYESFYKGFYKTLRTGRQNQAVAQPQQVPAQAQAQILPQEHQQIPQVIPLANPDHLTPEGPVAPGMAHLPEAGPNMIPLDPLTGFVPKANNFFSQDLQPGNATYLLVSSLCL